MIITGDAGHASHMWEMTDWNCKIDFAINEQRDKAPNYLPPIYYFKMIMTPQLNFKYHVHNRIRSVVFEIFRGDNHGIMTEDESVSFGFTLEDSAFVLKVIDANLILPVEYRRFKIQVFQSVGDGQGQFIGEIKIRFNDPIKDIDRNIYRNITSKILEQ